MIISKRTLYHYALYQIEQAERQAQGGQRAMSRWYQEWQDLYDQYHKAHPNAAEFLRPPATCGKRSLKPIPRKERP